MNLDEVVEEALAILRGPGPLHALAQKPPTKRSAVVAAISEAKRDLPAWQRRAFTDTDNRRAVGRVLAALAADARARATG